MTEQRVLVAYTDRERLDQFLTYLPERWVHDFVYQLSIFPNYYGDFANAYYEYRRNIQESAVFTFAHPEIQKAFEKFNVAIDTLYVFSLACLSHLYPNDTILDEIFLPEGYLKITTPDDIKEAQDRLNADATIFLDAYLSLLKIATEKIKGQETVEGVENTAGTLIKGNERITLPYFPQLDWINISIRFIDDRNVLISYTKGKRKDMKPSDYKGLGCMDGRGDNERPDDTWEFFLELAHGKGHTAPRLIEERETFRKRKQKLADILRRMFKNDTDPFNAGRKGDYHAKFAIEYPHPDNTIITDPKYADTAAVFDEMTAPRDEEGEL